MNSRSTEQKLADAKAAERENAVGRNRAGKKVKPLTLIQLRRKVGLLQTRHSIQTNYTHHSIQTNYTNVRMVGRLLMVLMGSLILQSVSVAQIDRAI